jgi:Tfp pilus assembly protein PilE
MSSRIFNALIATAVLAVLALAGSPAYAQSSLTGENAAEMARLLAVPAGNVAVPYMTAGQPR